MRQRGLGLNHRDLGCRLGVRLACTLELGWAVLCGQVARGICWSVQAKLAAGVVQGSALRFGNFILKHRGAPSPGPECRAHPLAVPLAVPKHKGARKPSSRIRSPGLEGELARGRGGSGLCSPHPRSPRGPCLQPCAPHHPRRACGSGAGAAGLGREDGERRGGGGRGGGTSGGGAEVPTPGEAPPPGDQRAGRGRRPSPGQRRDWVARRPEHPCS